MNVVITTLIITLIMISPTILNVKYKGVVVKNSKSIKVSLSNGRERDLTAKLIGGDQYTDVAVIKIENDIDSSFFYSLIAAIRYQIRMGMRVLSGETPRFYIHKRAFDLKAHFFKKAFHFLFDQSL